MSIEKNAFLFQSNYMRELQPIENELINDPEPHEAVFHEGECLVIELKTPEIVRFAELSYHSNDVIDPISRVSFEEGDEILVIEGQAFLPSTIARHIRYNGDQVLGIFPPLTLWKNQSEFRFILNLLRNSLDLEEEDRACIEEKISVYDFAKKYIEVIESETGIKFGVLLRHIAKLMGDRARSQGSHSTLPQQKLGFSAYYKIYSSLAGPIKKFIFPSYAYDPSDKHCISSSANIFKQQIERLESLELIDNAHDILSEKDFNGVINVFDKKSVEPSIEINEDWNGYPVANLNITIYNRDNVFLKIVSLENNKTPFTSFAHAVYLLGLQFNKNVQAFYELIGVEKEREDDFAYVGSRLEQYQKDCQEEMKRFIIQNFDISGTELELLVYALNNESINNKSEAVTTIRNLAKSLTDAEFDLLMKHPVCFFAFMSHQLGWKLPPFLICESAFNKEIESNKDRILVFNSDYLNPGVLKMGDQFHLVVGFNQTESELLG